jgi:hypothetical protein
LECYILEALERKQKKWDCGREMYYSHLSVEMVKMLKLMANVKLSIFYLNKKP